MPRFQSKHNDIIKGRTDTWACKLALYLFLALWLFLGIWLFDQFGGVGGVSFIVLCACMYGLPTVKLVEPIDDK